MVKVIWMTLLGFVLAFVGFFIGYFFVKQDGSLLSLIAIPFVGAGGFLVKKGADSLDRKPEPAGIVASDNAFEQKLEKNNELFQDYEKTDRARTKLKIMQAAAGEDPKRV